MLQIKIQCEKSCNEEQRNNELHRMYGDLVGKDQLFMRQWLRCHSLTNKLQICKTAKDYLKSKGLKFKMWIKGIKEGHCADILSVYLLCVITKTHCYIHLRDDNYWSSLLERPTMHDEYEQKCNLHLTYLGNGN